MQRIDNTTIIRHNQLKIWYISFSATENKAEKAFGATKEVEMTNDVMFVL